MGTLTDFQKKFLNHIDYKSTPFSRRRDFGLVYKDAKGLETGHIAFFSKEGSYDLISADYKIPESFSLNFHTNDRQLRFGLVLDGVSEFQMDNRPITNFLPAPFLAIEDHVCGLQNWKKGQHYKGIEIFVNMDHLASLTTDFPDLKHILKLSVNHAILYLPLGVIDVLHALDNAIKNETLTPLTLHAKVFECLALISSELENSETTAFYDPDRIAALDITSLHATGLTSEDIQGIQRAKSIINDNLQTPPTINQLSKMLYMNEQKLTSGFRQMFKMTIGSYIKDMRLSHAANLLSTTDLSIEAIASRVGYSHPSNFGKAFKAKYKRTPLQYRKFRSRQE
ncbi:helix-turn-helix transcriptional regulator [Fusibacter sp. JL216-2]|uniref:helix-turn-helix transcriptional regulator n=1 Tax=Fusibacter sp. JL216-2 TaxID=3071453 RepID=UPI003D324F83